MSSTAILAYIILSLAIGYAFVMPSYDEIQILMEEEQKYQESLDKVADIENRKAQLLTEFNRISSADKESINAVLPDSLDFTKLAADVSNIASKHGISVKEFNKKILNSSSGSSVGGDGQNKPYSSGIIGLTFDASYQKFSEFMDDLERSLRILDIRSLNIKIGEKSTYTFQVEFEAYWLEKYE